MPLASEGWLHCALRPRRHGMLSMIVLLLVAPRGAGNDWPQYHGPSGDRVTSEALGLKAFPSGGPPVAWKVPAQGGFSSLVVQGGRAYTLVGRDGRETLLALDA